MSRKRTEPVTTGQIYWGAVPFVFIQVLMVVLVILFPAMVMHYKGAASTVKPGDVKIELPQMEPPPPLDFSEPPNHEMTDATDRDLPARHWKKSPIVSGFSGATSCRFHQPPPSAANSATVSA